MKMTKQQFYDANVRAARDDTFPGWRYGHGCDYRFTDERGRERRCAAGLLLEEGEMPPELASSVSFGGNKSFFEERLPEGVSIEDLKMVQSIHDNTAIGGCWTPEKFLAALNRLTVFADVKKVEVAAA